MCSVRLDALLPPNPNPDAALSFWYYSPPVGALIAESLT